MKVLSMFPSRLSRNLSARPLQFNSGNAPAPPQRKKVTLNTIRQLYEKKIPISCMTAHDYPSGMYCDKAEIDIILVGDSLAMVALGYPSTNEITLDEMLHHAKAVARGVDCSLLVGDMPFGSYEVSKEQAMQNAIRYMREGRVEAIKLEGGLEMADTVHHITKMGIPVLGHVGLTPQRQTSLGGFKVQGKTLNKAKEILEDAKALQDAGCFGIVLEAIPQPVARLITEQLSIPTIGIGAGPVTSGQILVQLDALLGHDIHVPKFCHGFASISQTAINGLKDYNQQVKAGIFPKPGMHTYEMAKGEEERLKEWVAELQSRDCNSV